MRPFRYEKSDGNGEIAWGVMILCFGLYGCLYTLPLQGSPWTHWIGWLFLVCGVLLPYWISRAIKKFITWPRTGYVVCRVPKQSPIKRRLAAAILIVGSLAALTIVVLSGFVLLIALTAHHQIAIKYVSRLIASAAFVALPALCYWLRTSGTIKEYPWKRLMLAVMIMGSVANGLIIRGSTIELMGPVFLFIALVWLISGGTTLFLYLRHSQPPAPGTE